MAFTAETRWLARQEQSILSWAGKRRVQAEWARPSKGTRGGSALMRCASNSQEKTRVMLVDRARLLFTRTGFADLGLLRGMTPALERLRSTRL